MTDEQIAQQIIALLDSAKSAEDVLTAIKDTYCVRCGNRVPNHQCWCDYDSPLERDDYA